MENRTAIDSRIRVHHHVENVRPRAPMATQNMFPLSSQALRTKSTKPNTRGRENDVQVSTAKSRSVKFFQKQPETDERTPGPVSARAKGLVKKIPNQLRVESVWKSSTASLDGNTTGLDHHDQEQLVDSSIFNLLRSRQGHPRRGQGMPSL